MHFISRHFQFHIWATPTIMFLQASLLSGLYGRLGVIQRQLLPSPGLSTHSDQMIRSDRVIGSDHRQAQMDMGNNSHLDSSADCNRWEKEKGESTNSAITDRTKTGNTEGRVKMDGVGMDEAQKSDPIISLSIDIDRLRQEISVHSKSINNYMSSLWSELGQIRLNSDTGTIPNLVVKAIAADDLFAKLKDDILIGVGDMIVQLKQLQLKSHQKKSEPLSNRSVGDICVVDIGRFEHLDKSKATSVRAMVEELNRLVVSSTDEMASQLQCLRSAVIDNSRAQISGLDSRLNMLEVAEQRNSIQITESQMLAESLVELKNDVSDNSTRFADQLNRMRSDLIEAVGAFRKAGDNETIEGARRELVSKVSDEIIRRMSIEGELLGDHVSETSSRMMAELNQLKTDLIGAVEQLFNRYDPSSGVQQISREQLQACLKENVGKQTEMLKEQVALSSAHMTDQLARSKDELIEYLHRIQSKDEKEDRVHQSLISEALSEIKESMVQQHEMLVQNMKDRHLLVESQTSKDGCTKADRISDKAIDRLRELLTTLTSKSDHTTNLVAKLSDSRVEESENISKTVAAGILDLKNSMKERMNQSEERLDQSKNVTIGVLETQMGSVTRMEKSVNDLHAALQEMNLELNGIGSDFSAARNALREGLERFKIERDSSQQSVIEVLNSIQERLNDSSEGRTKELDDILSRIERTRAEMKDAVDAKIEANDSTSEELLSQFLKMKEECRDRDLMLLDLVTDVRSQLASVSDASYREAFEKSFRSAFVMLNQKQTETLDVIRQSLKQAEDRLEREECLLSSVMDALQLIRRREDHERESTLLSKDQRIELKDLVETIIKEQLNEHLNKQFSEHEKVILQKFGAALSEKQSELKDRFEGHQRVIKECIVAQSSHIEENLQKSIVQEMGNIKTMFKFGFENQQEVSQECQSRQIRDALERMDDKVDTGIRQLETSLKLYLEKQNKSSPRKTDRLVRFIFFQLFSYILHSLFLYPYFPFHKNKHDH